MINLLGKDRTMWSENRVYLIGKGNWWNANGVRDRVPSLSVH